MLNESSASTFQSKSQSQSQPPRPTYPAGKSPIETEHLCTDKNTTLLEYLLDVTWHSSMTIEERMSLIRDAILVNKTFQTAFARVMFQHPHFLCSSFYNWFLEFVKGTKASKIFGDNMRLYAKENVISMTFVCDEGKKRKYPRYDAVPYVRRDQLDGIFPNLEEFNVEYVNTNFWDPTTEWWVFFMPDTVDTLNVRYTVDATRRSYEHKEARITSFASGPYLHYTRVPEAILHMTVHTDEKSPITKENIFRFAAMFPKLESLYWNDEEIPLANGPVDMDMFKKLRELPESGPEREAGIKYFAINVARYMFQGGNQAFADTLKMLAREEPEVFAKETARMAAEGRLPKLVAALKKMEDDGLFDNLDV